MLKKYYLQFKQSAVLDYSGTHSLFARINCYRNLSNFAVGCLLSRVSQQVATLYRKSAFTLAETLIVMGIIGVVAALTLPNLNSSTANKEKVAKLQKIYSNLQDAFGRAEAVYGPTDEWCLGISSDNCKKRFFERISEFMKYQKKCTITDNCSLKLNAGYGTGGDIKNYSLILNDGTIVSIEGNHDAVSGKAEIKIDIDGLNKGKNASCYDYFGLQFRHNKGVYYNAGDVGLSIHPDNDNYRCTSWILENVNMDYLKCNDLKFGTKTTCK